MVERHSRPTQEELLAAAGKTVPAVLAPDLNVLFCGINPGLYTAAIGHHFGRPGNRFWPTIYAAGFTDRLLSPYEDALLLEYHCGITNVVDRATAAADELTAEELKAGGRKLQAQVSQYRPRILAVLGVMAYRTAFNHPKAAVGLQDERMGATRVWVLPNPSGLNAHYQLSDLAALFRQLREAADAKRPARPTD